MNRIDWDTVKYNEDFHFDQVLPKEEANMNTPAGDITSSNDIEDIASFMETIKNQGTQVNINTKDDNENVDNSTSTDNKYLAFLQELSEKTGTALPDKLTVEDADGLLNSFEEHILNKKVQEALDNKFKNANPYVKKFLEVQDYYDDDVKALEIIQNLKEVDELTSEDLEDEKVQEAIYLDELITTKGMSKEDAKELVEQAKTLAKLDSFAAKSKENLKAFYEKQIGSVKETRQNKYKAEQTARETEFNDYLAFIDKVESLGDIKLTPEQKTAIKKNITTTVKTEGNKKYNDFAYKQHKFPNQINTVIEFLNTIGVFSVDDKGNLNPDFSKLSGAAGKKLERKLDKLVTDGQLNGRVGTSRAGSITESMAGLGYNV